MKSFIKRFLKEEDGMGTVEIVIIVAILVGLALIFGKTIKGWVDAKLKDIKSSAGSGVNDALDTE